MKTIHQLFYEFNQLKNPSDDAYIKLGHDLAKNIVFAPKNEQEILWHFVKSKFSKEKNELITYGSIYHSELAEPQKAVTNKPNEKVSVQKLDVPKEPVQIKSKELEPIKLIEKPVKPKEQEPIKPEESPEHIEKLNKHKEKIAAKVNEIRASVAKLENNLTSLKEIKDPGFSMKMAINALEKFRTQMNDKHKPKP